MGLENKQKYPEEDKVKDDRKEDTNFLNAAYRALFPDLGENYPVQES